MNSKSNNGRTSSFRKISYPNYHLKLFFNGEVVSYVHNSMKKRFFRRATVAFNRHKWDKIILTVRYAKGYENKGIYTNKKDFEHAYRCFCEVVEEFQND